MKKVAVHKSSRWGVAPYRLVGVWSAPSRGLLEANPDAFNNAWREAPKSAKGSCNHCGTGITHHFIIRDAGGREFSIGSTCVESLGDVKLLSEVEAAERKRRKAVAAEKRRLKREAEWAERAARIAEKREAERAKYNGYTKDEVDEFVRDIVKDLKRDDIAEVIRYFDSMLNNSNGDFARSIRDDLRDGYLPYGRAARIIIDMAAKFYGGRANSKAYAAEYLIAEARWAAVESTINGLENVDYTERAAVALKERFNINLEVGA